jgi:preprotein translocase subunit YajC
MLISTTKLENLSKVYDSAVTAGDTEVVEQIRDLAITSLIKPFITNDTLGLEALEKYLENAESIVPIEQKVDKGNGKFRSEIMEKAKVMQQALETFSYYGPKFIKLNDPRATPEAKMEFYNTLANKYLAEKGRQEYLKRKEQLVRSELNRALSDYKTASAVTDEEVKNYSKKNKLVNKLSKDLEALEVSLEEANEKLEEFWNEEKTNEAFSKKLDIDEKLTKAATNLSNSSTEIEEAKDKKDLERVKTDNPVLKAKKEAKLRELEQKENTETAQKKSESKKAVSIKQEQQKQAKFIASNYNEGEVVKTSTGKIATIVKVNPGSITLREEDGKTYKISYDPEVVEQPVETSKTALQANPQLIMWDHENAKPLDWIPEAYVEYTRQPWNKIGEEVKFEIGTIGDFVSDTSTKAMEALEKGDFSNIKLLYDHLPIKVSVSEGVQTMLRTIPHKGSQKQAHVIYQTVTRPLRVAIVNELKSGTPIEALSSEVIIQ